MCVFCLIGMDFLRVKKLDHNIILLLTENFIINLNTITFSRPVYSSSIYLKCDIFICLTFLFLNNSILQLGIWDLNLG